MCLKSVATASFDTQSLVSTPTNVGHSHARRVLSRHHSCARVWTDLLLIFQSDGTWTHSIEFLLESRVLETEVLGGIGDLVFVLGSVHFGVVVVICQFFVRFFRQLERVLLLVLPLN